MAYRFGHCRGTRRARAGAQDWYQKYFEEHLARIEQEWQQKAKAPEQAAGKGKEKSSVS